MVINGVEIEDRFDPEGNKLSARWCRVKIKQ